LTSNFDLDFEEEGALVVVPSYKEADLLMRYIILVKNRLNREDAAKK
jgi:hypothetical protein